MSRIVAIVGRPNVGKSTLFNRLTRRRDALVADVPGLTRDRRYGIADVDGPVTLVDTGGLIEEASDVGDLMARQADLAIDEADLVLFVVDARAGLTVPDEAIATRLRKAGARVIVAVNKIDGVAEASAAEFTRLGFEPIVPISAAHGRGMEALIQYLAAALPDAETGAESTTDDRIRLAVIGRPNVGKSTLINRWLGEERQIVFDAPGTTRDAIEIPFDHSCGSFVLIDTAGVRRKGKVEGIVEKFSVVKSLEAMRSADVAVVVVDAQEGLVEQDLHVLEYAIAAGVGVVLAINKWDGLDPDARRRVRTGLDRRLEFAPWIPLHFISAKHGTGVRDVLETVVRVRRVARVDVPTPELNRVLEAAVEAHAPPAVQGRRIKLRYVHKVADRPLTLLVHGNQTEAIPTSYTRYLENRFRDALELVGLPIRVVYKTGDNPFAGRRNVLTDRQRKRRRRVMTHAKKRKGGR